MLKNVRQRIQAANQDESEGPTSGDNGARSWQDELKALKLAHIQKTAPGFFEASGGFKMKIKPYSDKTANGLTKAIIDFLIFSGHYSNRVNVMGTARIQKIPKFNILSGRVEQHEKVQYTKSMTAKGTPDIDAIIFGKAAKIEVKVGRDRISDEQTDQGQRIEQAGGLFFVARNMPLFLEWYYGTFRIYEKK
jgi:hypothetical protein